MEIPAYYQVTEVNNIDGYAYRLTSMVSFVHEEFIFRREEKEKAKAYEKIMTQDRLLFLTGLMI